MTFSFHFYFFLTWFMHRENIARLLWGKGAKSKPSQKPLKKETPKRKRKKNKKTV